MHTSFLHITTANAKCLGEEITEKDLPNFFSNKLFVLEDNIRVYAEYIDYTLIRFRKLGLKKDFLPMEH